MVLEEEARSKIKLEVEKWKAAFQLEDMRIDEDWLFAEARILDSDVWNSEVCSVLEIKFIEISRDPREA